jgi:hypothetical protein
VGVGTLKEVNPGKGWRKNLGETLRRIERDNLEATEYSIVARVTGCESENPAMLPGSLPYDEKLRSVGVKMTVFYEGKFWDVAKYVTEANQERDAQLLPFSFEKTEQQQRIWLDTFRSVVEHKALEAANDIRQGTGRRIPRSRIAKVKRFVKG